ncbi:alpha-factor pheromone receptor STE2 [Aspergillus clavatus NRRL 1]|uniref:Mating-type alpha-pheromone receptor PreB n=1 Tax=Aspergillus clavatus (strain ATCC 1007 / CBS 513.65 / DSM 816 / NCTC 3887 / NRRL 1 / QM 1276 / 107) TaxID=344612 RepID=A1CLD3_ASPCL|nr:mating-type alpha-pheromone receptor PreB [Aspergillus clavatus NRRL 1]EAW09957.1 mating-type alpha-pheromone receptor PreB [Aspergillus clavatus NRRL 1]
MNSTFDPFEQSFTLQRSDGKTFNTSLVIADHNMEYMLRLSINYGTQLGASIVLLLILMLLTRPEKRLSSVFLLNVAALASNIVRLVCQISYFSSGFAKTYALLAHDFSRVAQATYASQVMASVFFTLVLVCVEISLVLQVQVVCSNLRRRYRHLLLGASILVTLIPIGFRLAFMVENCIVIVRSGNMKNYHWLESATNIVATVSICFFCAIFVVKLGFAIKMRRRLGVKDFGPMKVIFIMGCQTMIIPALFSICQYWVNIPEFSHNLLTLVTISLPLSSIWAGFTLDSSNNTANSTASRRNLWNVLSSNGTVQDKPNLSACSPVASPNTTCYSDPYSGKPHHQDLEAGFGISVEHDISIHSYRKDAHSDV